MSDPVFPHIKDDELQTSSSVASTSLTLILVGSAESRSMGPLDTLIRAMHGLAVERSLKEFVVDMRKLDFMNSSCFKVFVSWVTTVDELPQEKRYRIRIQSAESKHWQRRSLGALACFAVELITIET